MAESTIYLRPEFFDDKERLLAESGGLSASAFRYASGVAALRFSNGQGEMVMLPFQGQQIWSAEFGGRNLTMRSMFDEPQATSDYLKTYGAFLIHCGFTAMGVPTETDDHPLHGELPNAPFQQAWVVLGEDEKGAYIGLGGRYQHTVAFSYNYTAEPLVKMYADSSLLHVSLVCRNRKQTPMEYMYLAHVNFRPVDNGHLLYSADITPQTVRVRRSIPSHVKVNPHYLDFLNALGEKPELHHQLTPGLAFDPEIVFGIDYRADAEGWAHTLQLHPDGGADYIRHRPAQLPVGVRWICRTPDQDAAGISLPATAEPEGYTAEKAKGYVKELAGGGEWRCDFVMGALDADEAAQMAARIEQIVA
ncbi:MAG: DUF4432 family protein [Caldilineaceae bacterium]|nr:DUF4432 family protein [Caldilineaceae bacterium]